MSLLCWDKPKKEFDTHEDYVEANSSSAEADGTYVPNMSDEDNAKWKARLVGQKSGPLRVEIRRGWGGVQMLLVVSESNVWSNEDVARHDKYMADFPVYAENHGLMPLKDHIALSMNGTFRCTFEEWSEVQVVIDEAREYLRDWESPEATEARRKAAQEKRTAKELAQYERLQKRLRRRGAIAESVNA